MSIIPWVQELRILAALFNPIMPFGIPNDAWYMAQKDDIFRVTVDLNRQIRPCPDTAPHYFLYIVDSAILVGSGWVPPGEIPSFRKLLCDDETAYPPARSARVRDQGSIIITTFTFEGLRGDHPSGVSFWFSKKRLQQMVKGEWVVQIMRNDDWKPHGMGVIRKVKMKDMTSWDDASV